MKCAYHNSVDAVATCNTCGKSLCPTCASVINPPQCISCYRNDLLKRKSEIQGDLMREVLLGAGSAVLWPVLFSMNGSPYYTNMLEFLLIPVVCAGIPFGWKFLNKITPNIFLFLPLIGWVIYFVCKLMLSICIGIFVAPFVIWKKNKEMKQVQHLIDDIANQDNKKLVIEN